MQLKNITQFKEISKDMTVLMVDDEINLTRHFSEIAKRFFKKVDIANSGDEAIECFKKSNYDIIYTDLNMPGMSGIELIRAIKSLSEKQKFIVISASDDSSKLMELLGLSISGFIVKPFSAENFINISMEQLSILLQSRLMENKTNELNKQLVQVRQEKKEQENMLIQQSKLAQTGEMISMIAHQWRQPLSSITMIMSHLKTRVDLGLYDKKENPLKSFTVDFNEMFTKVEITVSHLSKTINDFRNFYRPDNVEKLFNVCDGMKSVLSMLHFDSTNIDIDFRYEACHSCMAYTFESELKQVFMSIINNAIDAIREKKVQGPKIFISIRNTEKDILVSIKDNAGGIPEEIIKDIFLPYFSTKDEKNGTGLGLHMAKTIIEQHVHGRLSVQNSDITGGANFIVSVPQAKKG